MKKGTRVILDNIFNNESFVSIDGLYNGVELEIIKHHMSMFTVNGTKEVYKVKIVSGKNANKTTYVYSSTFKTK